MRPKPHPPQPGQESVWEYPRPPALEPTALPIRIVFADETILETTRAQRLLETSHPPTYYLPEADFLPGALQRTSGSSFCEWKGTAHYLDIVSGERRAARAAWGYDAPTRAYAALKGHVAVYAAAMDACYVADELVKPQPGGFYGGWITSHVAGPFKGDPSYAGSNFW